MWMRDGVRADLEAPPCELAELAPVHRRQVLSMGGRLARKLRDGQGMSLVRQARHGKDRRVKAETLEDGDRVQDGLERIVERDVEAAASPFENLGGRDGPKAAPEEAGKLAFERPSRDGQGMVPLGGHAVVADDQGLGGLARHVSLAHEGAWLHDGRMLRTAALKAALPKRYKQAARRAYLHASAVVNAGSTVVCPCCGRTFRKFAHFFGRPDQCPQCGSLMRHRAVFLFLRDALAVPKGAAILDVGPAPALTTWLASLEGVDYLPVDLDSPQATLHADVTDLPIGDDSFDVILCLHVLEHVPDDRKAMSELIRVLRPGGKAVIQVPVKPIPETIEDATVTTPVARERRFGQYDHVRICGLDYGLRLEAAGFDVTEEDYVEHLDAASRIRFGLRTGEPFYLCVKPARAR